MAISSNRDAKYEGIKSTQGGLYDVVMALRNNIMKGLNVATLAEVQTIDVQTQTASVKPFPLIEGELSKNITCYSCLMPSVKIENDTTSISWVNLIDNLAIHDVVLVVFLNRNSSQNLQQARKNQTLSTLNENSELHSDKFGIIVGLCYRFSR